MLHSIRKFNLWIFLFFGCFLWSYSFAEQMSYPIEITSAPHPIGSGARALGMGGAFIAIADDATAASWNPAGLFQLKKPEISFVEKRKIIFLTSLKPMDYRQFPNFILIMPV